MHSKEPARLVLIDALRGLAASWVAVFHLYHAVSPQGESLFGPLDVLLRHGDLGVQIFFVLSGLVIAQNVALHLTTAASLGRFILRRSIRLDLPYWAALGAYLFAGALRNRSLEYSPVDIAANVVYLDNVLGLRSIIPVGWTLGFEMQFYLVLASIRTFVKRYDVAVIILFVIAALTRFGVLAMPTGLFVHYFGEFCLGVFLARVLAAPTPLLIGKEGERALTSRVMLGAATVTLTLTSWQTPAFLGALTSSVTVLFLYSARAYLSRWSLGRGVQFLGKISYSLYLIHPLVGSRVIRVALGFLTRGAAGTVPWHLRFGAFLFGLLLSVVGAYAFYLLIERPAQRLSRRVAYQPKPTQTADSREPEVGGHETPELSNDKR